MEALKFLGLMILSGALITTVPAQKYDKIPGSLYQREAMLPDY